MLENILFQEFLECLGQNVVVMSKQQDKEITNLFKQTFPITEWGKIDWEKIIHKIPLGCNPILIFAALRQLLDWQFDTNVYVMCSDAMTPIISTELSLLVEHFEPLVRIDFEKFIFNPAWGYIIEIRIDVITVGKVDIPEAFLTKWEACTHKK